MSNWIVWTNSDGVIMGGLRSDQASSWDEAQRVAAIDGGKAYQVAGDLNQDVPLAVVDGQIVPHPILAPEAEHRRMVIELSRAVRRRSDLQTVAIEGVDVEAELSVVEEEIITLKATAASH